MMEQRYYVFPDIHGGYNFLQKALHFVYSQNPDGGKIIFLGDYIDRGKENLKVIQTVMNPPENWEFICLMGNHEQMFIESYSYRTEFYDFNAAMNIASFDIDDLPIPNYDQVHTCIPKSIIEWMYALPIFHFEDKNVFAHAYYDDFLFPEHQNVDDVLWKRMDDWQSYVSQNNRLYLTHGHTPRKNGPIKSTNRVNLDCGGVFYNRYVIGEYEKNVAGPVAFHEFVC